jgi:hypothetical protein
MFSATCKIKTTTLVAGLQFENFEYQSTSPLAVRCTISSPTGHEIYSEIQLKDVPHQSELEAIAADIHLQAVYRLEGAFEVVTGLSVCTLEKIRNQKGGDDDITIMRVAVARGRGCRASIIVERESSDLLPLLERPVSSKDLYLELLHHASSAENPVVRFLGYYQIVASLVGEQPQSLVDDFFAMNDIAAPEFTPKPYPSRVSESVYTRLRNEISHVRHVGESGLPKSPLQTRREIVDHVERLYLLARKAIEMRC